MKIRTYLLLLLLCCSACLQDKKEASETEPDDGPVFDERKWRTKDGFDYTYQNEMLQDLMEHQGLRAMKRDQILDLLGEPGQDRY